MSDASALEGTRSSPWYASAMAMCTPSTSVSGCPSSAATACESNISTFLTHTRIHSIPSQIVRIPTAPAPTTPASHWAPRSALHRTQGAFPRAREGRPPYPRQPKGNINDISSSLLNALTHHRQLEPQPVLRCNGDLCHAPACGVYLAH